jgi:hypothetical protein
LHGGLFRAHLEHDLGPAIYTNPRDATVDSMVDIVRQRCRNVKHWQRGDMRLRWAAGMLAAEAQFRRVKGYRQLPCRRP